MGVLADIKEDVEVFDARLKAVGVSVESFPKLVWEKVKAAIAGLIAGWKSVKLATPAAPVAPVAPTPPAPTVTK